MRNPEIRLLADENVAGLARWFRFMGFDTAIAVAGTPDSELMAQARRENRILITRDRELAEAMTEGKSVYLGMDDPQKQLNVVLEQIGITPPENWFQLCTECNVQLQDLSETELMGDERVPDFVKKSDDPSVHCGWKCERCKRVFWRGSHWHRTHERLSTLAESFCPAKEVPRGDISPKY